MLVDVLELRRHGKRLSEDQLRAAPPVRGWIDMDELHPMWVANKMRAPLRVMLLDPGGAARKVLEPLDHARVFKIRRGGLLIFGQQEVRARGRVYEEFRQAWWVRVVGQPERPGQPIPKEWSTDDEAAH